MDDFPLPKDDAITVDKAIQKIRHDSIENLYVFKNGKQKRRFRGEINSVSVSNKFAFELKDATLVHNHPSGSSFSPQDVQIMIQFDSKEMYLVTPNHLFYLKRPPDGWGINFSDEFLSSQLEAFQSLALSMIENAIVKNQISIYEKDIEFFHYLWTIFFNVYEISYQKRNL